MELSEVDVLVSRLDMVEKGIQGIESKRIELGKALEEYKRKMEVERRFYELSGLEYEDRSVEMEENLKTLRNEQDKSILEHDKLHEEILKGLSNLIIPMDKTSAKLSQREVLLPFRDGKEYPAIVRFIEKELGIGQPPVYVTLTPNGVKVVGINDELSAMNEAVKTIDFLKAKAEEQLNLSLKQKILVEEEPQKRKVLPSLALPPLPFYKR